jgi:DNA methylase N-4/N-6
MNEEDIQQVPPTTPNLHTDVARKLADLLPEVVADGKIDVAALQAVLGDDAATGTERFGLFWPGKTQAIRAAQTPTTATLAPDRENSLNWDATGNVVIEGDNLEVLKVLQKHYYGKIKMIYIDPPYNTGGDFVYPDDYADPIGTYLERTGQSDTEGKLSTNTESDGRFHSNWLNMMYPRLKLARNLLSEDGVLAISIDDNELARLRMLGDEIFGEHNWQASVVTVANPGGRDYKEVAICHESLLIYTRTPGTKLNEISKEVHFKLSDRKGGFELRELRNRNPKFHRENRPNLFFPFYVDPTSTTDDGYCEVSLEKSDRFTVEVFPRNSQGKDSCWRWGRPKASEHIVAGSAYESEVVARQKRDGGWNIYEKSRRSTTKVKSLWAETPMRTEDGTREVRALFGATVFDHPKPLALVRRCAEIATNPDSIVLDFFAGSGTTAHAVMALNAEDGGNRRCISVQLPESTDEQSEARKAGYANIAEITRERIRRAGAKILEEESAKLDGRSESLDVGFRAYKLVDTNFAKWRADSSLSEDELASLFAGMGESVDDDARPEALLTEVLLKLGFSLTEQVERVDVAGLEVFSVADGLLVAYLNEHVKPTLEQLRAMVALEPGRLVVLEDAFQGDDVLKTNLVQECRSHGVDLWTA